MTKSDAYFYRLAMPRPFAKGNGAALTPIAANGLENKVNFLDGFPTPYSAPASDGGRFVTRGEMNAIGNLASQNQFYFLAGGINTFDEDFCIAIGGYPEGAILDCMELGVVRKVISLHDNNKVNFLGGTSTHGTENGITDGSVNAVDWQYADVGAYVKRDPTVVASFRNYSLMARTGTQGEFMAGFISLAGTYTATSPGYLSIIEQTIDLGTIAGTNMSIHLSVPVGVFLGNITSLVRAFSPSETIVYPTIETETVVDPQTGTSTTNYVLNTNGYVNIGLGLSAMHFYGGHTSSSVGAQGTAPITFVSNTPIPSGVIHVVPGQIIVFHVVCGVGGIGSVNNLPASVGWSQPYTASFDLIIQ